MARTSGLMPILSSFSGAVMNAKAGASKAMPTRSSVNAPTMKFFRMASTRQAQITSIARMARRRGANLSRDRRRVTRLFQGGKLAHGAGGGEIEIGRILHSNPEIRNLRWTARIFGSRNFETQDPSNFNFPSPCQDGMLRLRIRRSPRRQLVPFSQNLSGGQHTDPQHTEETGQQKLLLLPGPREQHF